MHAWQMVVLMTSDAEGPGSVNRIRNFAAARIVRCSNESTMNFENQYWDLQTSCFIPASGGIQFWNIECARALNISRRWNRTLTGAVSKSRKCIRIGWLQLARTRQFPFLFSMNWPSGKCQMHRQCGAARPNDAQSCRSPPYPQLAESRHDNMHLSISLIFGATVLVTS